MWRPSSTSMADRSCDFGGSRPLECRASVRRSLKVISFGRAISTACALNVLLWGLLCIFACSGSSCMPLSVFFDAGDRTRSLLVSIIKKVWERFGWGEQAKFCPIETLEDLLGIQIGRAHV